jgi:outer membrane protein assembly factor BamB
MRNRLFLVVILAFCGCIHSVTPPVSNENGSLREVWKSAKPNSMHWGVEADPIIDGDRLYITFDSTVECLDRKSGNVIWSKQCNTLISLVTPTFFYLESGKLFAQIGGSALCCYDANSGQLLWKFTRDQIVTLWIAPYSLSPNVIFAASTLQGRPLLAISKMTGQILWEVDTVFRNDGHNSCFILSAPVYLDGRVFVSGDVGITGEFFSIQSLDYSGVACFDAASGARLWERDFKDSLLRGNYGQLTPYDTTNFVQMGPTLLSLDSAGATVRTRQGFLPTKAIENNGRLYGIGSGSNIIMAMDALTGIIEWSTEARSGDYYWIEANRIANNYLYSLTFDNWLVAHDLISGASTASYDLKPYCINDTAAVEAIHIDGNRIYFVDRDFVRCLEVK